MNRLFRTTLILFLLATASACTTVYYDVWESFGVEKRDLLKSNVENARDTQEETQRHFMSALQRIKDSYGMNPSKLEDIYDRMSSDYEESKQKADELHKRIASVEDIGADLFEEWRKEAKTLDNQQYREDSFQKLDDTKAKFNKMVASMKAVEKKLPPLLKALHDQVIYLKHNLNAQALTSLKKESASIESDIGSLINDLNQSIAESNRFINTLGTSKSSKK